MKFTYLVVEVTFIRQLLVWMALNTFLKHVNHFFVIMILLSNQNFERLPI